LARDAWAATYRIWAEGLGLKITDERVARMVVKEKLAIAMDKMKGGEDEEFRP
jgi:hypothetical protein